MKLALTKSQSESKLPTTCSTSKWIGSLLSLCGGRTQPSPISEVVASRVKQWIAKSFRWRLSKWKASLSSSAVLLSSFLRHEMTARRKRWTSSPRQTIWLLQTTLVSNRRMDSGALHWEETAGWHALRRSSNKRNISARPEASKSANRRSRVS